MKYLWLGILVVSGMLLFIVLNRAKINVKWIGYAVVNLIIASLLLYGLNLLSGYTDFRIPLNLTTMSVIAVLGIPGLLLLVSLKLVLF